MKKSTVAHLLMGVLPARFAALASLQLEGGPMTSVTARRIARDYQGVDVGSYSYGPFLRPGKWPRSGTVGRYTSVASTAIAFRRDHPAEFLSTHPYFHDADRGLAVADRVQSIPLTIGNDVWIGHNVVITKGCRRIGDGAVVGAGSIVTRDVDAFAIVAGNPAQRIGERFDEDTGRAVAESRWWDLEPQDLVKIVEYMNEPSKAVRTLSTGEGAPE